MNRREFNTTVGIGLPLSTMLAAAAPPAVAQAPAATAEPVAGAFQIGMLIFDNMTNLDFAAPHDALTKVRTAQVHVLAKSEGYVTTDTRGRVLPDKALRDSPQLDLIFIGGGNGTTALMEDGEVLEFLRAQAVRAKWITSVCTGALVLGAAGLLRGYQATTHWNAVELLPLFGATPSNERVVFDRNRITGGGVTAGLDFGLTVIGRLFGDDLAELITLGQEYDPAPPYATGSPRKARAETVGRFRELTARVMSERRAAAERAAKALPPLSA
jgi:cyclohexyl-isocyanide hydratase